MIKRPFFTLGKRPRLPYPVVPKDDPGVVRDLPPPERIILPYKGPALTGVGLSIHQGDRVRTGERFLLASGAPAPLIATTTGRVAELTTRRGDGGKVYPSVILETTTPEEQDNGFLKVHQKGTPETVLGYLEGLPGMPLFSRWVLRSGRLHTLIISGMDQDLLTTTNQFLLRTETKTIAEAIEAIKKLTGIERIVMAVPPVSVSDAEKTGAEVVVVRPFYPSGNPRLIVRKVLKQAIPMTRTLEEGGIAFLGVDTLATLQPALSKGEIPAHRIVTVVNREGIPVHARVRVGAPVSKVLEALEVETRDGDRVVVGGPMTGRTLYTPDEPVLFDTQGIMVQDRSQVLPGSDTHCINCGDCVRACPAHIPVNVLIRFLENGLYQDAVDACDLLYCIECGLCAYVCPARIPIYHYIALGKYEFAQQTAKEAAHA